MYNIGICIRKSSCSQCSEDEENYFENFLSHVPKYMHRYEEENYVPI